MRADRLDRYGLLLAMLVALFLLLALQEGDGPGARAVVGALAATAMFLAARTSGVSPTWLRRLLVPLLVGALLVVVGAVVGERGTLTDWGRWTTAGIVTLMIVAAPVVILGRILRHRTVTIQTVLGAVCVYLLLGLVTTTLLATLDGATEAEMLTPAARGTSDYAYASFITLTTVGFGDVVAAGRLGRTILMLEALVGQVFLVTLVARLVSMFGKERDAARPGETPEQTSGTSGAPDPGDERAGTGSEHPRGP